MKFLLQGAQRSLLRGFGRRYLATSTEQYAKRNYANNLSEYNTVFTSLTAKRRHYLLRDAYDDMVLDGVQPSRDTFHSLIAGTMKGSRLQDAFYFRDEMKTMGLLPDVVLYNFLISTCGKSKNSDQAIKILDEMKNSGVKPNGQTYICLLNACAAAGQLDPVYAIVRDMTSAGVGLNKFCYAGLIAAHKNKTPIAEDVATKIIELVEQSKGWSSVEASTGENAENVMMNVSEEELYNLPTADYVHKRRGFLRKELTVFHVAFHAFTELKNVQAMEVLVEMLKSEKKDPDVFILLQIMRSPPKIFVTSATDDDKRVLTYYPFFIEVLIEGAMVGHTPRGMQIALDKLEEMTQRSFFLFPKIANDLLLIAAGDKKGGYTTANYIWDLTQARKMPLSFPAVEAYYNGLKVEKTFNDEATEEKGERARLERMSEEHKEQEQVLFLEEGKKKKLKKEAEKAHKRGVCYISRVPPGMDHVKLRQLLSQYGEIQRIYLAPQNSSSIDQVNDNNKSRKRGGGAKAQLYSEGWVEFASKSNAKRVANLLNGEQIGGKKRSQFYYDHWNIKYLSKFKWDNLTDEIAYKKAIREQKLALEISAAKRERDFYLKKVDQSRALSSIEERMKKKQKVQQESGGELSVAPQKPAVCRQFPQKKPIAERERSKPQLSKDVLAGVSHYL
ncbi:hypothetical protein NC651_003432 [Populus alba x Populus x berolinensis]|nr:hypothetical protein NC651_003432 [Populus alba x Populus x berolinensis]